MPEGISTNYKVAFLPPKNVDLVGSYLLRTIARPTLNVDVSVEMPAVFRKRKEREKNKN